MTLYNHSDKLVMERGVDDSKIFEKITQIDEGRILNHLQALVGDRNPDTAPNALKAAASYILDQMKSSGLHPTQDPIDAQGISPFYNVVGHLTAMKPGNKRSEKELLVIGAHYDTVAKSPGADDNASGLAVLLEVARVLSSMQDGLIPQFLAFSMEEIGFVGSDYFLRESEKHGVPIWGAIVLECVGYTDRQPGSQKIPPGVQIALPDRGDFIGLIGNVPAAPIQNAFEYAVQNYVPELPVVSLLVPGRGEAVPDSRRSDHVPFWDKGYPAVMLTDTANFRNPHYHNESDCLETLDVPFITNVARALAATIMTLAQLKEDLNKS